jgi:hypothetical protein
MAEFEQRPAQARAPVEADLWKPFTTETPDWLKLFIPQPTGPRMPIVLD